MLNKPFWVRFSFTYASIGANKKQHRVLKKRVERFLDQSQKSWGIDICIPQVSVKSFPTKTRKSNKRIVLLDFESPAPNLISDLGEKFLIDIMQIIPESWDGNLTFNSYSASRIPSPADFEAVEMWANYGWSQ